MSRLLLYKQGGCWSRCCAKALGVDYSHTESLGQSVCIFTGSPTWGLSPTTSVCFLTISSQFPQHRQFSKLLIFANLEKCKCLCVVFLALSLALVGEWNFLYSPALKANVRGPMLVTGAQLLGGGTTSEEGAVACCFFCQIPLPPHTSMASHTSTLSHPTLTPYVPSVSHSEDLSWFDLLSLRC